MSDWREGTLSDIAEVIMGQSPKGDTCNEDGNGLPLLNGPTEFGADHPFPTQFTTDPKKFAKKGDVLFCVRGSTTGRMNWANQEYAIGRGIASIRSKSNKYNSFIYHLLNYRLPYLLGIATGSTFPNVTKDHINELPINIPDSLNLEFINNTLFKLDNKITLLRQQNQDLEELAQVLFKRWFVEFEFPNENGEPYKSSGGKMVESELGEIPEGWRVDIITELFEVKDGTHDSPKQKEVGKKLITSKHLNSFHLDDNDAYLISEDDFGKINKRSKVEQFDILFSMIGTIGLTYYEQNASIDYAIKNVGLFKTSQNEKWAVYCYLWLTSFLGRHFIATNKSGSTQEYVSLTSLRNIEWIMPSEKVINDFNSVTSSMFRSISNNTNEIQTLTQLRDTLLPKLMSGELKVDN